MNNTTTQNSSALAFRRRAVLCIPLVSAVLIVAGFFLDPDIGGSGRELAGEYAENPGRIQASALAFHFAFALLIVPAFTLIRSVRGRGAWVANVAGILAVLGMTTLPGFLLTDFYDVAIYGELGGDAWDTVDARIQELPGAMILFLTGFLGFMLALPVALAAAARAGLVPAWIAVATLLGSFAAQALPRGIGLLVMAAVLATLTYVLGRSELHTGAPVLAPGTATAAG